MTTSPARHAAEISGDEAASAHGTGLHRRRADIAIPWLFGAALVAALLLLHQPYRGVRHDAVLYLGQILVRLDPSWAGSDLYFAFGSQDKYSLFSRLLEWPIAVLGIPAVEMGALLLGRACTFWALYLMVDSLPVLRRWLALAAMAGMAHYYGGKFFSVLENFVTARTFAEPLALLAMAALLKGRKGWCLAALLACFAAHPLVALPAAVTIWIMLVARDRRWLWCAASGVAVLLLAWAGVAPFDRILQRFDPTWFYQVAMINGQVFVSEWSLRDFTPAVLDIALLWFATRGSDAPLARLGRAACIATPLLCVLAFIGADVLRDVLVTQLQLWRAIWVSHVLAVLWMPSLVLDQWRRGPMGRLAAVAVCCVVPAIEDDWATYGWALAAWAGVALVLSARKFTMSAGMMKLAMGATLTVGVATAIQNCNDIAYQIAAHKQGHALAHLGSLPFQIPMLSLAVIAALLLAWQRPGWRPACVVLAVACLAAAGWQFDQRAPFTRYIESARAPDRPFQDRIPVTSTVYWEDAQLAPVWLLLGRAGFAEDGQFSGLLFNRATAEAATARFPFVELENARDQKCSQLEGLAQGGARFDVCRQPEEEFLGFCNGKAAHADFLVTTIAYGRRAEATWRFDPRDGSPPVAYFLHDCAAVRAAAAPSPARAGADAHA